MRGLLDSMDDPRTMGLLSLGLGLLGSRGSFGEGLAQAGPQALMAMRQVRQDQEQRQARQQADEMRQMQMEQARAALAQQQQAQARQAAIESAYRGAIRTPEQMAMAGGGGPTMAAAQRIQPGAGPQLDQNALIRGLMQADPMAAAQMLQPKPADYKVVGDALVAVTPGGVKEAYRAPAKEDVPSSVREFLYAQQNPAFTQWENARRQAGATRVQVDAGQRFENAYSTDQGKQFSQTMADINKAGFNAPSRVRKLERMEQLLQGVDGGRLAPTGLEIASAASSIGIKIDPKLGNKEAAQALAREIAGEFREPGTGPMTDKDFENFLLQVPDLSKTAEGRRQITATMKAKAARDIQIARLAREYEKRNGRLDNGFLDEAAQFIAENPVIGLPAGWKVR